ncbi:MAG: hypothetical protein Q7Q73_05945 [Verrucomicrobiota bacterium JB024]|nr:hypothetical protein [Verrucomicrobiota bacterium JB024]
MMKKQKLTFHLLPNAHLDPVWLWDWREGLTEGITTVKTVLDLMDEVPDLTFNRGEASIYRHIQRYAPDVFARILEKVQEGRWDVVGGTIVQPDSNLSSTETLCRQFEAGLEYFQRELGVRPRIAWQADSFGHPAGWPNILRSFGMEGFMFTRPQREQFTMASPLFWWKCDYQDRLLCYRQHYKWYCSQRANMPKILDITLEGASAQPYRNVSVLMGLGNHGGGPTRRNLADVAQWAQEHPEVEIVYSTMHRLFEALQAEIKGAKAKSVPEQRGEFGYCLRGCYSSVQRFKSLFRQAEAVLPVAEASQALIGSSLELPRAISLDEAWDGLLFNSFHDILPGSSIERAIDDQMAWTGGIVHQSQKALLGAMSVLAAQVDTRVPPPPDPDKPKDVPFLIWNPSPATYNGPVELEASLDYRPLWDYEGRPDELKLHVIDGRGRHLPFQRVATEHNSMPHLPWRCRVVAEVEIEGFGWKCVRLGIAETTAKPSAAKDTGTACQARRTGLPSISHPLWRLGLAKGGKLSVRHKERPFFSTLSGLRLMVVDDPWGSWGGMVEEPESYCLDTVREHWSVTASEVLESGPERSVLWTRWGGERSWCDLTFYLNRSTNWVDVRGRLLWNERSARLQLCLPSEGDARCDVPGSVIERTERGQVPVGRWFTRRNKTGDCVGVFSDNLSDADFLPRETRLTLARATRYATDVSIGATEMPWLAATDCGELKFRLALFGDDTDPENLVTKSLQAPVALPVTPGEGSLPPSGSFGTIRPASVRLLSAQAVEGGLSIRVQNRSSRKAQATFVWAGKKYSLGSLGAKEIATRRIETGRSSGLNHS